MKLPEPVFTDKEIDKILAAKPKFPKVSFLFVTRNRCPHKDPFENPLVWAFLSLESSRVKSIDEYVIVDDGSNDYTGDCVAWLRESFHKPIIYLKNRKRKGCSYSRRIGIRKMSYDIFYMGDDDCLYKPDFVFGSLVAFIDLRKQYKDKLSVLGLPVYDREISYSGLVPKKEIGKTDFERTWFFHNFDKFPEEYLESKEYIASDRPLFKPIEVETFKGVSLNLRKPITNSGNFLDLSMWDTDYSEHIELSYQLVRKGYKIFFLPDPRISCTHLMWGAKMQNNYSNFRNFYYPGVGVGLDEILRRSNLKRKNTGSRVDTKSFHICEIGSFFSFYLKMERRLAIKFAVKEYKNFVLGNVVFSSLVKRVQSKNERKDIWEEAIKKGIRVTKMQTGQAYKNLFGKIMKKIAIIENSKI